MPIRASSGTLALAAGLLLGVLGCGVSDDASGPQGGVNNPPVLGAVRDTTIALGDTLGILVSATDPDGDEITYHLAVSLTWEELRDGYRADASLGAQTGYFWFKPGQRDVPNRQFQFIARDGRGGEDDTWMTVTVTGRR
jgi:hypothetical protein